MIWNKYKIGIFEIYYYQAEVFFLTGIKSIEENEKGHLMKWFNVILGGCQWALTQSLESGWANPIIHTMQKFLLQIPDKWSFSHFLNICRNREHELMKQNIPSSDNLID